MNTRAIIDYAVQDDASGMREALYAEIMDRVNSHIEIKKQEIAQGFISEPEYEETYEEE
jgi:hypothetical protein